MRLLQVYNLGYDASKIAVPRNGFAIHHPAGNFARLSMYNSTACAPGKLDAVDVIGAVLHQIETHVCMPDMLHD